MSNEPVVAWMFQHEETGRMSYVSNDGMNTPALFLSMNPRYTLVCVLYGNPVDDTALLRQAWEALRNDDIQQRMKAIAALRERLGEKT
jgi:hypothetical protein